MLLFIGWTVAAKAGLGERCWSVDPGHLVNVGADLLDLTNDHTYPTRSVARANLLKEVLAEHEVAKVCELYDGPSVYMVYMLRKDGLSPMWNQVPSVACKPFDRDALKVEWLDWGPFANTHSWYLLDGQHAPVRRAPKESRFALDQIQQKILELGVNWRCNEPMGLYGVLDYGTNITNDPPVLEYWLRAPASGVTRSGAGSARGPVGDTPRTPPVPKPRRPPPEPVPDRPVTPTEPRVPGLRTSDLPEGRATASCVVGGELTLDPQDHRNNYLHYHGDLWFRPGAELKGVNLTFRADYLCTCVACPTGSGHSTGLSPEGAFKADEQRSYDVDCVRDKGSVLAPVKGYGSIEYFVATNGEAGVFRTLRCDGSFTLVYGP